MTHDKLSALNVYYTCLHRSELVKIPELQLHPFKQSDFTYTGIGIEIISYIGNITLTACAPTFFRLLITHENICTK
jgi:hypothetical protein